MYPKTYSPHLGIFVKEQLLALRKIVDGDICVISPVAYSPKALSFKKKWRNYRMEPREFREGGIEVLQPKYMVIPGSRFYPWQSLTMFIAVKKLIIDRIKKLNSGETILHSHALLPAGLAGGLIAKKAGVRSVCTLHGGDIQILPHESKVAFFLSRKGMAASDSFIAVSNKIKEGALSICPSADVEVITNGFDANRFNCGKTGGKSCRILFVGRCEEAKGIKELLEAFNILHKNNKELRLTLVGEPILKDWISNFIQLNKISSFVEIAGAVKHQDLPAFYNKSSIFVLPSYTEGMPTVLFEAMGSKLPVVVTAVGGVPEVIKDGVNGLLIQPRSVKELVEKIGVLLSKPALSLRIAEQGYDDASSNYTWDASAKKLHAVYKRILKDRGNFARR